MLQGCMALQRCIALQQCMAPQRCTALQQRTALPLARAAAVDVVLCLLGQTPVGWHMAVALGDVSDCLRWPDLTKDKQLYYGKY